MGLPLTQPVPGINYNFVAGAYLICSAVLAILLALDKCFGIEAVAGAWIVFAPFPPCLAWALAMRAKWLAARSSSGSSGSSSVGSGGSGTGIKPKNE